MPWFPDFVSAVELVRRQTRAAGQTDPVGQYFTARTEATGAACHERVTRLPGAGAQDRGQARTLFAQTMGYVAVTAALFALGAWLGRSLAGGAGIIGFVAAFAC
jgi:hypothetical protein